jgi:CRISPR-associated endonuclease/helicase Cas3
MMLTVLAMLKMLRQTTRFILMSATFSPIFLQKIAYVLEAEAILADNYSNLFADVPSVQTQERTFFAETGQLSVETVLQRMGQRTLCICNTVDRAQALYKALKKSGTSVPCYLLHARFYREDRQKIELFVQDQFEHSTKPILLISTQAIEVGVDISSDVLLTECAPAASLIQRAGRCARRAGQQGIVYVFQPYDDKGEINYAPYKDNLRFAREHGRHCYLLNLMGKFCVLSRNNAS